MSDNENDIQNANETGDGTAIKVYPQRPLTISIKETPPQQMSARDFRPNRTGILASARDDALGTAPVQITEKTRIKIPTPEGDIGATVQDALNLGLLIKDANGVIREPSDSERAAMTTEEDRKVEERESEENKGKAPSGVPLDNATEQLIGNIMGSVEAAGYKSVNVVVELLAGGYPGEDAALKLPKALEEAAKMYNVDAADAWRDIRAAWDAFDIQAAQYITSLGEDPEAVFEYANRMMPSTKLNSGRLAHVFGGKLDVYAEMVKAYRSANVGRHEVENIKLPPGAKLRTSRDGKQFVEGLPSIGFPIPVQEARRRGLI
jgi:hypothetical protein